MLGLAQGFQTTAALAWTTTDLDGDGKADLVQTEPPDGSGVWGGDAVAYGKIYKNIGSGFASAPTQWSVPMLGLAQGFQTTTAIAWITMDLDGDGKADLVQTEPTDGSGVWGGDAAGYWKVFRGIP